ncbi:MAG: helix-turn-helix domain-containing protein [Yoonia sp.]
MNAEKKHESEVERFGRLVRSKRRAKGWSLEALAAEAFSNSTRKGYISQIENAKIPNITRENVRSVARALEMSVEEIPTSLRWQSSMEEANPNSAYLRAVGLLSSARRDFLSFERMYLSAEDANQLLQTKRITEHLMCMILNTFFWKREREGNLQIYGKSYSEESGPFLICDFEVPDSWIGCGVISINYVREGTKKGGKKKAKTSDKYDLLLVLYLSSPDPRDFEMVFQDEDENAPLAFLAALQLNSEQVQRFYQDARENFEDIE